MNNEVGSHVAYFTINVFWFEYLRLHGSAEIIGDGLKFALDFITKLFIVCFVHHSFQFPTFF